MVIGSKAVAMRGIKPRDKAAPLQPMRFDEGMQSGPMLADKIIQGNVGEFCGKGAYASALFAP